MNIEMTRDSLTGGKLTGFKGVNGVLDSGFIHFDNELMKNWVVVDLWMDF